MAFTRGAGTMNLRPVAASAKSMRVKLFLLIYLKN